MASQNQTLATPQVTHVLVIEDDALVRGMAASFLEECGYAVSEAATADAAIPLLQDDAGITLVFSDIQMPGELDGFGLARWIARCRADVKVLLTSGKVAPKEGRDWTLLPKPYRLAEVEYRLRVLASAQ